MRETIRFEFIPVPDLNKSCANGFRFRLDAISYFKRRMGRVVIQFSLYLKAVSWDASVVGEPPFPFHVGTI